MGVKIYIFGFGEFGPDRVPERSISHYCKFRNHPNIIMLKNKKKIEVFLWVQQLMIIH